MQKRVNKTQAKPSSHLNNIQFQGGLVNINKLNSVKFGPFRYIHPGSICVMIKFSFFQISLILDVLKQG